MPSPEHGRIHTRTVVHKFIDPDRRVYELARSGASVEAIARELDGRLVESREIHGNLFLTEGINLIWTAVTGGTFTPFNSANAHVGVGDGTDPASYTQTGLTGVNKSYKPMDAGYPTVSERTATFRATFGPDDANFAWNEWTVANGPGDAYVNLNRKVESLGTKSPGSTWILTVQLTIG